MALNPSFNALPACSVPARVPAPAAGYETRNSSFRMFPKCEFELTGPIVDVLDVAREVENDKVDAEIKNFFLS